MQRILYYIFIYNILFEGVFEGEKPPPTSLRRGERKKLSGISNPPILADTKREMPNEGDCSGRQPRKVDRCGEKRGKERSVNVRRNLRTKDLHPIAANGAHKASMNSRIVPP